MPKLFRKKSRDNEAQDKRVEMGIPNQVLYEGYFASQDIRQRRAELEVFEQHVTYKDRLVLDVGCGTGINSRILRSKGANTVGVDIAPKLVNIAHQLGVQAVVGDIEAMPFKTETFDLSVCGGVLHHFPALGTVVGEIARVMKPGGLVLVKEPNGSNPGVLLSALLTKVIWAKLFPAEKDQNERIHTLSVYVNSLESKRLQVISIVSHWHGPSVRKYGPVTKKLVHIAGRTFHTLLYRITMRALQQPYSGPTLYITACKR